MPKKEVKRKTDGATIKKLKSVTLNISRLCIENDEPLSNKKSLRSVTADVHHHDPDKIRREKFLTVLTATKKRDTSASTTVNQGILKELNTQEVEDLSSIFEIFDVKNSGNLSFVDLLRALRFLRFDVGDYEVKKMFGSYEYFSDDDSFDISAFLSCVIECQSNARDIHEEISEGFQCFDLDSNEKISLQNLRYLNRKTNLGLSELELKEMLDEADLNGDEIIDKHEFMKVMMKTNLFN